MMQSGAGMAVEKIDRVYFCAECGMVFLFKADAVDHQKKDDCTISEMPFE